MKSEVKELLLGTAKCKAYKTKKLVLLKVLANISILISLLNCLIKR